MTAGTGRVRPKWAVRAPGATLLRHYERRWLRGDVVAGVTVSAYLIPQVMAYAEVAGLPAVVGLWTCMSGLLVYALLGSSRQLSVGPESTTALMTGSALAGVAAGDPARQAALAATLALLVGGLCLLGWVARLGFLAELLSRPVLTGYMAGVAILMVVSQLGNLTGIRVPSGSPAAEVAYVATHLGEANRPTVLLGASVLVFALVVHKLLPRAPVALAGMLLAAAAVAVLGLQQLGVSVVGEVPRGLPDLQLPRLHVDDVVSMLPAALGIALVAFSDNILTGRIFAARRNDPLDSTQELLALGAVNAVCGLTQGFPVSSSGSRTAIADNIGARTQAYSLVAVGTVLASVAFLGPVLAAFPTAALGAIVVYAAAQLVDVGEFRRIARFRRTEQALAVGTTVAVLALGALPGVLVAVGLSVMDMLHRVTRPHDGILGYVPGVAGMHDVDDYPDAEPVPGLVVYRYDSPLFFANARDFTDRALLALDAAPTPVAWFLLNAEANVSVDLTAVDTLESLRQEVTRRGVVFAMARVKQDLRDDLDRAGFLDRVGPDRVFMTLPTAVTAYVAWYVEEHGVAPGGFTGPP
ncbi:MAG: SulP family inorganic anion transporter [Dermatophilaceae bacterium]